MEFHSVDDPARNQSIERATAILRAVAAGSPNGSRPSDIAAATGLSRSTTHRLLAAMVATGLIEQEATGLFHLGWDLFAFGTKAASRRGLVDLIQPILDRLAERTSDTVFLSVRSNAESLCIDRREGSFPIRTLTLSVGDRRPLGVGAGSLALLACLADAEIETIISANLARLEAYAGFDTTTLLELVVQTRRQGYAFNNGRILTGMSGVGVVVTGDLGEPVVALSVAAIDSRMQPERRENVASLLRTEARALSEQLGRVTQGLSPAGLRRLLPARHR
jgi:DNA-binding IclR family transcriptional regulator